MKIIKLIALCLSISLCLFLVACSSENQGSSVQDQTDSSDPQDVKEVNLDDDQVASDSTQQNQDQNNNGDTTDASTQEKIDKLIEGAKEHAAQNPDFETTPTQTVPTQTPTQTTNQQTQSTQQNILPSDTSRLDSKTIQLLQKLELKVNSVSYIHTTPPTNAGSDKFFVKDDKMKIVLGDGDLNLASGFSEIYLSFPEKKAVGYCFERDPFLCFHQKGKISPVDYEKYYKKTGTEWMQEIVASEYIGSQQIDGRTVFNLNVELANQHSTWESVNFFVDNFYGYPVEIVIKRKDGEKERYTFENIVFNQVSDEEITPPNGY